MGALGLMTGCPGVDSPPGFTGQTAGDNTSNDSSITTFAGTIDPTSPTSPTGPTGPDDSTQGESMDAGSTMGSAETTQGPGTTTDDPGTTTDDPGTTTSTTDPGTTTDVPGSTTDPGTTTAAGSTGPGCNGGPGNYDYCLDMGGAIDNAACMAAGATCLVTGMAGNYTGAVCALADCVDPCDCPAAPMTGNAVISCDDVTGNPADLFCYLDCSMGEACPTGMECFGGYLCVWPGPGAGGTPYGDCLNNDNSICGLDGICLNDGAMPTIGVCTNACNVVGDCPAAPPGGTSPVVCSDVTADMMDECSIDCSGGTTCPTGMSCFGGFICAWM